MDANGNKNGLLREMVETKERAVAWLFRILIALVGAASTTVLWMGWSALQEVKGKVDQQSVAVWQGIQSAKEKQIETAADVKMLTQTLGDNIKMQTQISSDLKAIVQDHEQRIRGLERPAR